MGSCGFHRSKFLDVNKVVEVVKNLISQLGICLLSKIVRIVD